MKTLHRIEQRLREIERRLSDMEIDREIVREIASCGVVDTPGIDWVDVQVDRDLWARIQQWLEWQKLWAEMMESRDD